MTRRGRSAQITQPSENSGARNRPARDAFATARSRRLCPWWVLISLLFLLFSHPWAITQQKPKRVLILFSYSPRNFQDLNDIESALRTATSQPVDFDVQYLDGRRFDDEEYENDLKGAFEHTYHGAKFDLVFLQSLPALKFATKNHDTLFPGVPFIFIDVDPGSLEGFRMGPGVTGVAPPMGIHASVNLALKLHPNANTVAIITGNASNEMYFLSRIHSELLPYQNKVREIDLAGLPTNQLLEKIVALPSQTIVFFQLTPQESVQPAMGVHDVLTLVSQRLPTYSIFPYNVVGLGGVGGVGYDWQPEVLEAAQEARQIWSGKRPEDIPVVRYVRLRAVVDWRQLQHWHIPESALPPDTVILFRPPTLWDQYKKYFVAAIVVTSLLLLLVIGLLWERTRKRKAEAVLRESEKRFRVMADTTPSLIWMCDTKGKIVYLNDRWAAFLGFRPGVEREAIWPTYVHLDDLRNVSDVISEALDTQRPFSSEYRLRRSDGTYRWIFDVASPRINGDGSFAGFIGSALDITDQKQAQQALENVSGQLIEAQEQERTRIARDLHDDICQRLALLSMELEQTQHKADSSPANTKRSLEEIRIHCSEIASDVQSLSHQLHSSKLEYLGITAAIRGFCNELSRQHEITIEFTESNVPRHLPKDISLCLFRVAQEALHNAVKYSEVSEFAVELAAIGDEVRLVVSDSGAGFDVEQAKKNRGLGLVSMQERVHLVHGVLSVESKPREGTRVVAIAPLAYESASPIDDEALEKSAGARGGT